MNKRIVIVAAFAAIGAASSAYAAGPVTANTTANAVIVAPQQLTATRNLDFGTIAKPFTGVSTITVAPTGAATQTPTIAGGNAFVPIPGQAHAAVFHMLGTNGQTYTIQQPSLSFGAAAGNLSNIATSFLVSSTNSASTTGALPANGQDDLFVGGQFDIDNVTAVQTYSGTVSVTVVFN